MRPLFSKSHLLHFSFICFAATTVVFGPNTSIFRGSDEAQPLGDFIFPMLIAAFVTSFIWIICTHGAQTKERHLFAKHLQAALITLTTKRKARLLVALSYVIATSLFLIPAYGLLEPIGFVSAPIVIVAGAVSGSSFVVLCVQWASVLACKQAREALIVAISACIGSACLSTALSLIPLILLTGLFPVLLTLGALGPLLSASPTPKTSLDKKDLKPDYSQQTRDLISTVRLPAIALMLYAFMMSVIRFQPIGTLNAEYLGGIVAACALLPLVFMTGDLPYFAFIYRVVAPSVGGLVVVLMCFPETSVLHQAAFAGVYLFLSALAILALAQIIAIMHAGEFSASFVTCNALICGTGISLVGLTWEKAFGGLPDFQPLIFVLIALYCASMLITFGWESWIAIMRTNRESLDSATVFSSPALPEKPKRYAQPLTLPPSLAQQLSPRETEIASYLGRGYSMSFIAEKLFISESTVRTHAKHIYAKLNIHSREELFTLIDSTVV